MLSLYSYCLSNNEKNDSANSTKSASTASTGISTDDCSTDEKSSLSSTPEFHKNISAAKAVSVFGEAGDHLQRL